MSVDDLPEFAPPPFSRRDERVFSPGLESDRMGIFSAGMKGFCGDDELVGVCEPDLGASGFIMMDEARCRAGSGSECSVGV